MSSEVCQGESSFRASLLVLGSLSHVHCLLIIKRLGARHPERWGGSVIFAF